MDQPSISTPSRGQSPSNEDTLSRLERVTSALNVISRIISDDLETEEIESLVTEECWKVLNAQAGSLFLLGREIDTPNAGMLFKTSSGREIQTNFQVILERHSSLVEICLSQGRPLLLHTLEDQESYNPRLDSPLTNENTPLEIYSLLCVPLIAKESILGALEVVNKLEGSFSKEDQELLSLIAVSLANTLHNIRLIQEMKVANAALETNRWQLMNSQNILRALFDNIPASMYIINRRYQLMAVNRSRLQQVSPAPSKSSIIGDICYEALMYRDSPCPDCRILETLFEGQSTNRSERRWAVEEEPEEWEINSYPIFDDINEVQQSILLEQNVTEKRRLEATLAQSEKLAAVGQLAAGVAHEINNPLTAILANAQLLQREISSAKALQGKKDMEESLELILRAGARAIQVVRNLLNFARKERYELVATDVNENIRGALSLLHHEIIGRPVEVLFDPGELPPIQASPNHLQGVWLNLILNALDSIVGGHGVVRIQTSRSGSNIQVKVSDSGKGIPVERISRIFEPFYTTKAPDRGTGLGLSVCHRIVKQHRGHILVDSHVDIGTEFTVVLPIT